MKFKLRETSASRLYRELSEGEYKCAIISGYVSDENTTEEDNQQNMVRLKKTVRDLGYGYTEFISRWVQDGVNFDERSLMIGKIEREAAIQLGIDFNQYSIIYKDINGCVEICTRPFDNFQIGDTVRTFNIAGNHILNIEEAQAIFAKRIGGPVSMPIKGDKRPFTLKQVENYTLEEVLQPNPSVFQTEERRIKIL